MCEVIPSIEQRLMWRVVSSHLKSSFGCCLLERKLSQSFKIRANFSALLQIFHHNRKIVYPPPPRSLKRVRHLRIYAEIALLGLDASTIPKPAMPHFPDPDASRRFDAHPFRLLPQNTHSCTTALSTVEATHEAAVVRSDSPGAEIRYFAAEEGT